MENFYDLPEPLDTIFDLVYRFRLREVRGEYLGYGVHTRYGPGPEPMEPAQSEQSSLSY